LNHTNLNQGSILPNDVNYVVGAQFLKPKIIPCNKLAECYLRL